MKNNTNLIAGILSGAAVGLTLGVLYAPDKGSETRKKIREKAVDAKDTIVERSTAIADQITSKLSTRKNEFEQELDQMLSNVDSKSDDAISALERKLEQLKQENGRVKMN